MTRLLEEAFCEAAKLPDIEQNLLAKWLLEELQSEAKWQKTFAESEAVLEKLAQEAIDEKRAGKITTLDLNNL